MLQYKMYPAGELRCPTTALVFFVVVFCLFCCCFFFQLKSIGIIFYFSRKTCGYLLTFTSLWANKADSTLMIFFLIFTIKQVRHFMQIVSSGDKSSGVCLSLLYFNLKTLIFFYTSLHDSGGVLWFHVGRPCVRAYIRPTVVRPYVCFQMIT